jgi:hypothetical protein
MHEIGLEFDKDLAEDRPHRRLVVRLTKVAMWVRVLVNAHDWDALEDVPLNRSPLSLLALKGRGHDGRLVAHLTKATGKVEGVGFGPVEVPGEEAMDEDRDLHGAVLITSRYSLRYFSIIGSTAKSA